MISSPATLPTARRVGILTLPFNVNYGGILQSAALYQVIEAMGHEPVLLTRKPYKSTMKRAALAIARALPWPDIKGHNTAARREAVHHPFIRTAMPRRTGVLRSTADLREAVVRHRLDAVVVGSDQVWRPQYHGDDQPLSYWLDFVDPTKMRRVSYAASFGSDEWKHPALDRDIAALLADFRSVSVREASGAAICRDHFGYGGAEVVVDPVMLADPGFLAGLAEAPAKYEDFFLDYVLDMRLIGPSLLDRLPSRLPGADSAVHVRPHDANADITINAWLGLFAHARYIVTDSFHGTIVAILFRKQFVTVFNPLRGGGRFHNILGQLGLEARMVSQPDEDGIANLLQAPIDYAPVFEKIENLRARSHRFLETALG